MKIVLLPILAICTALLASQATPNDEKPLRQEPEDKNRIVLDVSRVNMLFTVSDKKGRFVTDLGRDDFQIFENKKPQSIIEFNAESNLPLRLAILIDTSNSI